MDMKRGQAFETMMLVISVIVAVAILGVLLGFIGSINLTTTDAKMVMTDLLKKVDQQGHGLELKVGEFAEGSRIFKVDAIGELPIPSDKVEFACANSGRSICGGGSGAPLSVTASSVVANQKISAAIVVCKTASGSNKGKYYVCIGDKDNKNSASNDCASKCALT
ncbi:MAG: hypothetical protein WC792_02785 [Candidatus Micrarchaeia archaeon]|jgi:hypothetical protein